METAGTAFGLVITFCGVTIALAAAVASILGRKH